MDTRAADRDGIACAQIHGVASRHTPWRDPTGDDRTAAIAELRDTASSQNGRLRADLLSRVAGLFQGLALSTSDDLHRQQHERMAALIAEAAGDRLDAKVVAEWTAIGRERARPKGNAQWYSTCWGAS